MTESKMNDDIHSLTAKYYDSLIYDPKLVTFIEARKQVLEQKRRNSSARKNALHLWVQALLDHTFDGFTVHIAVSVSPLSLLCSVNSLVVQSLRAPGKHFRTIRTHVPWIGRSFHRIIIFRRCHFWGLHCASLCRRVTLKVQGKWWHSMSSLWQTATLHIS